MRQGFVFHFFQRIFDGSLSQFPWVGSDRIAFLYNIRRNVHAFPIDHEVIVPDQLPRGVAGFPQSHTINDIIQTQFKALQQIFSGDTFFLICRCKVYSELFFQYSIKPFNFLFFPELNPILGEFLAALTMLAGKVGPPLNSAFCRLTTAALKE